MTRGFVSLVNLRSLQIAYNHCKFKDTYRGNGRKSCFFTPSFKNKLTPQVEFVISYIRSNKFCMLRFSTFSADVSSVELFKRIVDMDFGFHFLFYFCDFYVQTSSFGM